MTAGALFWINAKGYLLNFCVQSCYNVCILLLDFNKFVTSFINKVTVNLNKLLLFVMVVLNEGQAMFLL